ncbi:MAG: rhodanese-like domain-containing protein [Sarcina sp.]
MKVVNVNDIDRLLGKINLIDVREPSEVTRKALATSKNIPMNELLNRAEDYLKKDEEYYIICQSGGRSSMVCSELEDNGFNVVNVAGGTGSYLGQNLK